MFVLLYSVCRSVSVLSCADVIQCFTYVLRVVILDVTKRRGCERAREKARGDTNGLSYITSEKKSNKNRNIWLWLVCCCLLPTYCFHRPFTLCLFIWWFRGGEATLFFSHPQFVKLYLSQLIDWRMSSFQSYKSTMHDWCSTVRVCLRVFEWMNENLYIAHKKNFHTKSCMFTAPDTHSAYM